MGRKRIPWLVTRLVTSTLGRPTPWYLSGGIAAANCLAAFKPKGAADYATSKVNLVTPGTNDAADGAAYPTWAAETGWTFVDGSLQYLTVGAGALATAVPISMVCRFQADTTTNIYILMSICDTAASSYFVLDANGAAGGDKIIAVVQNGATAAAATSTTFTANTPYTAAAVFSAANAQAAYLDGGGKGTGAISSTPTGLDTTYIGAYHDGSALGLYLDGKIFSCAFYNIALSDAQVLAIHTAMAAL